MFVSFLILTRNRLGDLQILLRSIEKLERDDDSKYEIIILDNASDTPLSTDHLGVNEAANPIIIRSEKNLGVPGGRNLLAAEAKGEWLFFLDDDSFLVEVDLIPRIRSHAFRSVRMGAIACNLREYYKPRQFYYPFTRREVRRRDLSKPMLCSYFVGGAHLIKREVYFKAGGYDKNLFFFGEELDLSYRILNIGYEIQYNPDLFVIHRRSNCQNINEGLRSELILRNKIYLNSKYLPLKYQLVSDSIWVIRHLLKTRRLGPTIRAVSEGKKMVKDRMLLTEQTIKYLRENCGRLYY